MSLFSRDKRTKLTENVVPRRKKASSKNSCGNIAASSFRASFPKTSLQKALYPPLPRCCNVRHGAVETRPESPLPAELRHTASDKRHLKAFPDHIRRIKDTDMRMSARGASVSQRPPVPDAGQEPHAPLGKKLAEKEEGNVRRFARTGIEKAAGYGKAVPVPQKERYTDSTSLAPQRNARGEALAAKGAPPA